MFHIFIFGENIKNTLGYVLNLQSVNEVINTFFPYLYNYHIAPSKDVVMPLNDSWIWQGNEMSGSSVSALKKLGN